MLLLLFSPWQARRGFVCAALEVPITCRVLLQGTDWRDTFCSALAAGFGLPAGMERMCALHYPLGSLRNQCHLLELQRPATNKGLLQRWAGQPHFSESVLLTCFSHRTGNPEVARVVLPQVTLVWEPWRIFGLSLCYGK